MRKTLLDNLRNNPSLVVVACALFLLLVLTAVQQLDLLPFTGQTMPTYLPLDLPAQQANARTVSASSKSKSTASAKSTSTSSISSSVAAVHAAASAKTTSASSSRRLIRRR